jgi:hypothetical protein
VGKPFRHQDRWNLPESFWDDEPDPAGDMPLEEEDRLREAWDEKLEAHYWSPAIMDGSIPICHLGCAQRQWLVINGLCRGQVWCDDRADNGGLYRAMDGRGARHTFESWYLSWLAEVAGE